MPALFTMSDDKKAAEAPAAAVVIAETPQPRKKKTKKYVIIAVSVILGLAIVLAAILVGMYIFTEAQKEIIKYSLDLNNNAKQDVVSDPNTNVVQYHVTFPGQDVWVINDFNKDIQVVKIQTSTDTNCFMNPLNRSIAMDPSQIADPYSSTDLPSATPLIYVKPDDPVADISFLSKAARDMCSGISTFWVYPHCSGKSSGRPSDPTSRAPREKRESKGECVAPYCDSYYTPYNNYSVPCVEGCCVTVCACYIKYSAVAYTNGTITCSWYVANCPPYVEENPVEYECSDGPDGLDCPNQTPAQLPTC